MKKAGQGPKVIKKKRSIKKAREKKYKNITGPNILNII